MKKVGGEDKAGTFVHFVGILCNVTVPSIFAPAPVALAPEPFR